MKNRFMEDVEARRRNVKKTQIVIDHAVQDTFENNPDESHADYKASDKMDSIPTRGLAKTMTEKSFQDVETREKATSRRLPSTSPSSTACRVAMTLRSVPNRDKTEPMSSMAWEVSLARTCTRTIPRSRRRT